MQVKVSLDFGNNAQEVGVLVQEQDRFFFKYAPSFLETGLQISPFKVTLDAHVHDAPNQVFDGRFDRGILVAHGEFDGNIDALLQKSLGMAARDDERRAFGRPNGRVGVAGFLWAVDQDDSNNEPAENPRHIDHAAVHEEFVEIAAHIRDGRRIGGA